jgi:2-C-methyl-D-erythritol 4-phosphate cytidylyltransferase
MGNMINNQKTAAIIVAAGESTRMGGRDKMFAELGGKTILTRVLDTFQKCQLIDRIILVVNEKNVARVSRLVASEEWDKVSNVCAGGKRRQDSVAEGLKRLKNEEWVLIHDGARPLVTADIITRGLEAARETGAAAAAVPVTDTIKVAGDDEIVLGTPPRQSLRAIQTPQVFRKGIISQAYQQAEDDVTDDAALVEKTGHKVKLYMGSYDNIKITNPEDLALAEVLLKKYEK